MQLDLAHDYARAGFVAEAIQLLQPAAATAKDLSDQSWGALPLVHYTLGWLQEKVGDAKIRLEIFQAGGGLRAGLLFSIAA